MRPLLINDTVYFEQKFFMRKIAVGQVDLAEAYNWYKKTANLPVHSQSNIWNFIRLLLNFTLPSKHGEIIPRTFSFDEERLFKLRQDMQDLINLEICISLYRELGATSRINKVHLTQDDTPVTSTPCSSPSSTSSTPETNPPTQCSNSAIQVRSSLQAILVSSSTSDKWTSLLPNIALQILRSTPTSPTYLPQFESHLGFHLSNSHSKLYLKAEACILLGLGLRRLISGFAIFLGHNPVALHPNFIFFGVKLASLAS
jgi:hypothetical protein